jgi:hypothetical protein
MSEQIFRACKELIDDAKLGCADLVFKDLCLEVLSRARNVLSEKHFGQLIEYAADKMKEKILFEVQQVPFQG